MGQKPENCAGVTTGEGSERSAVLDELDGVPEEDLAELVERWREAADYAEDKGLMNESDGINGCADELESLLG